MKFTHDTIERKTGLLIALVIFVVSIGGLVEIVPLFFQKNLIEPVAGAHELYKDLVRHFLSDRGTAGHVEGKPLKRGLTPFV